MRNLFIKWAQKYVIFKINLNFKCFWMIMTVNDDKKYIKAVLIVSFLGIVILHLIMKAPVWALIMRLNLSGSDYHRYQLIDHTIGNFGDWWWWQCCCCKEISAWRKDVTHLNRWRCIPGIYGGKDPAWYCFTGRQIISIN